MFSNGAEPDSSEEPVLFSEEYYRHVIQDFDYRDFDMHRFDFQLAGMGQNELNIRYLCHHDADCYVATPPQRRVVTTGFGMSGPPHMATASHIMKMIRLQEGGENCQIVLGDLDAYSGRALSHGYVNELASRFHAFVIGLGFNDKLGIVRCQEGGRDPLSTMYLLGRYATEDDFAVAEEDNHAWYVAQGIVDPLLAFGRRLSLSLMAADFIALGQSYDAVLVMLGIDEHRYVRFAQDVAARFDQKTPIRGSFTLAAIYTRMNTGFNGYPKFSKSIPESGISVETSADEIRRLVQSDEVNDPMASPVFQLMCQMGRCSHETLLRLYNACADGTREWRAAKEEFTGFLVYVQGLW